MIILPNGVAAINGDTHHRIWVETEGLVHDKWMASILKDIITQRGVKVAIDVGANIGTLAYPMLEAGAKVYCIEANPEAYWCLAHNVRNFPLEQFKLLNVGVSDKPGKMALKLQSNAGATYLAPRGENLDVQDVDVITIDSLNLNPGLIKMDIEGMEHHALHGAVETIARSRPVLVMEINQGALERAGRHQVNIFDFLMNRNYALDILQPDCNIHSPQYDIVCYPR